MIILSYVLRNFKDNQEPAINAENLNYMDQAIKQAFDARIVEHNLDVADPPNGYYVRWENGLQVCTSGHIVGISVDPESYAYYDWTPPAEFVELYAVLMVPWTAGGDMSAVSQTHGVLNLDTRAVLRNNSTSVRLMRPHFIAIGRWK